jgi:6-hydroxy-3-succinoylpyridine 3-monooxygenase
MLQNTAATGSLKARCTVYIDGYNWYFGVFRHHPEWKWLNIQAFFEELRLDEDVTAVKLFTALVEPHKEKSDSRERLQRYLKALRTLPKMQIVMGKYQNREVTCRGKCGERYLTPEEKKTDVNMAVHLLDDAMRGVVDSMVIVSGDSDIEPAVQWVRRNHASIKITVYIPAIPAEQPHRRNDFYSTIGVNCRFLPLNRLGHHQLPIYVDLGNGEKVSRPFSWPVKRPDTGELNVGAGT